MKTENVGRNAAYTTFKPRPAQQRVLDYRRGRLGISAVPGSGKTQTLSYLAALLVQDMATSGAPLAGSAGWSVVDTQEVLVVTFSNSAVENFRHRIGRILEDEFGLLPNAGYRVRTLHALANDIVRMRPALVGLADDFQIADERMAAQVLDEAVAHQLALAPDVLDPLLSDELDEKKAAWVKRDRWPDLARQIAAAVIRRAKDMELTPAELHARLGPLNAADEALLKFGLDVYETYQRGLQMRNTVDFDDLIRLALQALHLAPDFLARLRRRWPYVLEDEAQDSSELQEKMLRLLTDTDPDSIGGAQPMDPRLATGSTDLPLANNGNWVRVGDPNQAINTTFTTADPKFLRRFLNEPGAERFDLPDSGRSTVPIIELANYLVDWTVSSHPAPWLRANAFLRQAIRPTPPGDPQPNPQDGFIYLDERSHSPEEELAAVADSLQRWLPEHPDWTVAVLVPENSRGFQLAEILKSRDLSVEELLRSSAATREVAGKLELIIRFLAQPDQRTLLADLYQQVWWSRGERAEQAQPAPAGTQHTAEPAAGYRAGSALLARQGPLPLSPLDEAEANQVDRALRRIPNVEDLLYPSAAADWLVDLKLALDRPAVGDDLQNFRAAVQRWLEGSVLPIDQLLLTLGNELFTEAVDLALTHKLAVVLAAFADANPAARLAELADELALIARNERRFLGFDTANVGYEPAPGVVTIATMHAAKGLEWDRVYLMALNNYSFPSAQSYDSYLAEPWFVRDHLNPEAETLARLEAYVKGDTTQYLPAEASRRARLGYAAERLRLFYVGMTRAKRDLVITWNYGRFGNQDSARRNQPAVPFLALHEFWKARLKDRNRT